MPATKQKRKDAAESPVKPEKKTEKKETVPADFQDEVRKEAHGIYISRIERGITGSAEGDWAAAEKNVMKRHKIRKNSIS